MSSSLPARIAQRHHALGRLIWDVNVDRLAWWQARAIGALRITLAVFRDFLSGQLSLRATSLVFTTLLSLVPLLAVAFSVLKGFGVHNQLEPALLNFLAPLGDKGVEITNRIIGFVENVKAGVIGSLGLGLLFYTIISLMHKIERAFNYTWHVHEHRSISERFGDYLSVIIVGPVLVFSSMGLTAAVVGSGVVTGLSQIQPFGWLIGVASRTLPYVLVVAAFTLIYVFMPNTRVRVRSALVGGVVAGVLWQSAGVLFATFVAQSPNYAAIYSAFATLIVFMFWLYVSWLILLIGASIAFYHQHPEYLAPGSGVMRLSDRLKVKLALMITALIGDHFYRGRPAWDVRALARHLALPVEIVKPVLEALESADLIARTDDDPPAFVPGRPFEATPLKQAVDAVRQAGEGPRLNPARMPAVAGIERLMAELDTATERALDGYTLKDIALSVCELGDDDATAQPGAAAGPEAVHRLEGTF